MDLLLKVLGGKFGAAVLAAAGMAFALMASALAVQSHRLDARTAQLATARAALKNPLTGRTWRAEATAAAAALKRCADDLSDQSQRVRAWEAEGKRLAAAAAAGQRQLVGARAVAESRSQAVMAVQVDAATCDAREAAMLEMARKAAGQ